MSLSLEGGSEDKRAKRVAAVEEKGLAFCFAGVPSFPRGFGCLIVGFGPGVVPFRFPFICRRLYRDDRCRDIAVLAPRQLLKSISL